MLIGEEEHAPAAGERPFQHGTGIGAGADDAAVPAAEGFEVGRRIDVRHRHHVIGIDEFREVLPCGLDRFQVGHIGHAAAGGQVGEIDRDLIAREDVGRLGHEMDAAEHDGAASAALRRELAELVTIASEIGVPDHLVLLIMVAQDQQRVAQLPLDREDSLPEFGIRSVAIRLKFQGRRG